MTPFRPLVFYDPKGLYDPGTIDKKRGVWLSLDHNDMHVTVRVMDALVPQASALWSRIQAKQLDFVSDLDMLTALMDAVMKDKVLLPSVELRLQLLSDLYMKLYSDFVHPNDIHSVVTDLPVDAAKRIVRTFFQCQWSLVTPLLASTASSSLDSLPPTPIASESGSPGIFIPKEPTSHILKEAENGNFGLFALFSGQGSAFLEELSDLYLTYPFVRRLIKSGIDAYREEMQSGKAMKETLRFVSQGFDVLKWISDPASAPDAEYLLGFVVSGPLILLTQITHVLVACRSLRISPSQLARAFKGASVFQAEDGIRDKAT